MAKCRHRWRKSAVCKTLVVWFCIYFFNSFLYLLCFISSSQWPTKTHTRSLSWCHLLSARERDAQREREAVGDEQITVTVQCKKLTTRRYERN